jgi:hypothetical protein
VNNWALNTPYNQQLNIERIDKQIEDLTKLKNQYQQPLQQPTNLTQNFSFTPTNREIIKYVNSIEDVQKDIVVGDTPYFSKDMKIVWVKSLNGDIKTYELNEIVQKDDKDIQIEFLQAQLNELKGMIGNAKSNNDNVDEPIESKKSSNVSNGRTSTKKSK